MKPPREIPDGLFDGFTMGGKIKVEYAYSNDLAPVTAYTKEAIDAYCHQIKQKKLFYYCETDACLYRALEKYSISAKKVAIMGSGTPLYESVCLSYGGFPTTIEYKKIISEDDRLTVLTVEEHERNPRLFDAAFSISSFEHSGLGRYGDPIDPEGDFQAMTKMKSVIKKGGIFFLSVPVGEAGEDTIVWNLHRIYGKLRLPKLLKGWKILGIYGWLISQPVFVLENSRGSTMILRCLLNLRLFHNKLKRLKIFAKRVKERVSNLILRLR